MLSSSAPHGHFLPPAPPAGSGRPGDTPAASLPSLLSAAVARDPYPHYRLLRERHPLVRDELLGAWLLSRYADVRAALVDVRLGAAGAGPSPKCRVQRGLVEPALRAAAERTAFVLARRVAGRREVDLVAEFSAWLPAAAAVAALGLPWEDAARVREWCRTAPAHTGGPHPELGALLHPHVARRRAHPGRDLLSVLCGARVDGRALSDEAVTAVAGTLLAGGGEATGLALASFLANLLDHPAQLTLVRARPGLIPGAWAESLRRDPPAQVVLRHALAPISLGGTTLPAGALVACLVGSAGRDPFRFADPDRYDIFRPDPAHLAFGAGQRFCPAAALAALTAECGLRALLDAMPGLRWAPGSRPAPQGLMARAPRRLLVRPC